MYMENVDTLVIITLKKYVFPLDRVIAESKLPSKPLKYEAMGFGHPDITPSPFLLIS